MGTSATLLTEHGYVSVRQNPLPTIVGVGDHVTTGSSRHGRAGVSFLVATVGSTFTTLL